MDPNELRTLQLEVWTQCQFVVLSRDQLAAAEAKLAASAVIPTREEFEAGKRTNPAERIAASVGVWLAIQGIVVAAGNLQKLFWGSSGKRAAERKPLRDSLGIKDSSPLHDIADLRNGFEHFDERIVEHVRNSPGSSFISRNIGISDPSKGSEPHFGHYDPPTATVTFWSHAVSLTAIVNEASRVLSVASGEVFGFDVSRI